MSSSESEGVERDEEDEGNDEGEDAEEHHKQAINLRNFQGLSLDDEIGCKFSDGEARLREEQTKELKVTMPEGPIEEADSNEMMRIKSFCYTSEQSQRWRWNRVTEWRGFHNREDGLIGRWGDAVAIAILDLSEIQRIDGLIDGTEGFGETWNNWEDGLESSYSRVGISGGYNLLLGGKRWPLPTTFILLSLTVCWCDGLSVCYTESTRVEEDAQRMRFIMWLMTQSG
ncbi:hypothetical protein BY996DRAFT_6528186 [Phakopsora pachyrhizi]|nr:hypothetical protein BY996DRAFT_6528186 [Phakopsora pachyrhizi]